jgi:hypothetical protein
MAIQMAHPDTMEITVMEIIITMPTLVAVIWIDQHRANEMLQK